MPGILNPVTVRCNQEDFQADINTGVMASWWQWVYRHVSAGEAPIPAVRFMSDADRFDGALEGATPPHGNAPNLGEDQKAILQRGPVAELLVGETGVAALSLKAWVAGLFTILHPAKEGSERRGPTE